MSDIPLIVFLFAFQGLTTGWSIQDSLGPDPIDGQNQNNFWYIPSSSEKISSITTQKPCDKSLLIKKDVEDIVNYMYDQLNLNESIKNSYYKYAIDARDGKVKRLAAFGDWFSGQPEQLKHIIEDIAENHKYVESRVNKISKILEEQKSVQEKINKQTKQYEAFLKKYVTFEIICEDNTTIVKGHKISKRNAQDDQYCGSAKEIKEKSTTEMQEYVEKLKPELLTIVKNISQEYDEHIQNMENKIKDIALKDYGLLMYDTLLLQEEYHNYKQLIGADSEKTIYEIKKSVMNLDGELISLGMNFENYKKHCLSRMEDSNPIIYRMSSILNNKKINSPSEFESLLDIVIKSKIDQIQKQAVNDISYLFHDVEEKIQVIEERDTDVKNFKPVQDDLKKELRKEKESLNDLKKIVSKENIYGFLSLQESVESLVNKINKLMEEIQTKLNIE